MTPSYAELEISLVGLAEAQYQVGLRYDDPDSASEFTQVRGLASIDPLDFLVLQDAPGEYGKKLAARIFEDAKVQAMYGRAKTAVEISGPDKFLRVKLFVDRSAPELDPLRWELLVDPDTGDPLATSARILFSRFGSSNDWRDLPPRRKTEIRALVAVSNPTDLAAERLAPVDVEGEIGRAREQLKKIPGGVETAGDDAAKPLTLNVLADSLRDDKVDILYLVCHGALSKEEGPLLYLQDDAGKIAATSGAELARRIAELQAPPRLVVLASCESAGSEKVSTQASVTAGHLVPLAPLLAEAGVHAVLAMQGKISMETVAQLMPVFFSELLEDGQIDRALAVARGNVRDRPDFWMPALFLRLKRGAIWYTAGFADDDEFDWDELVRRVGTGKFTPVVGPGLGERAHGTLAGAARQLAGASGFPLAEHQRSELPPVAQYLQFAKSAATARERVYEQLQTQVVERHAALPAELKQKPVTDLDELNGLLLKAGEIDRHDPADPYGLLARLPARVFITANTDGLLEEALRAENKKPDPRFFNWRDKTRADDASRDGEGDGQNGRPGEPEVASPLVFHYFGYFTEETSLVLTEDDYFDYLISLIQYRPRIPAVVGHATTNAALLFLGFQLTDWSFRVLFRLIMSQEGAAALMDYSHVAVQVDPDEPTYINPKRAREYLEKYFGKSAITIFWGSAGDFLEELGKRLQARGT